MTHKALTLGTLLEHDDSTVVRHAQGILKRLWRITQRWTDEQRFRVLAYGQQHPYFMDAWREDKRLHPEKYARRK